MKSANSVSLTDQVIHLLTEIAKLMELKGENRFKIQAFDRASEALQGRDDLLQRAQAGTLVDLPGVGHRISEIMTEFLLHGRCHFRDELVKSLPEGLLELTQIPGLGPKKATLLIQELGVRSMGELEYACKENRLLNLKGFGLKSQKKILEGIAFRNAQRGHLRLADALPLAESCVRYLEKCCAGMAVQIHETGALRRRLETLDRLEFLVELSDQGSVRSSVEAALSQFQTECQPSLPILLYFTSPDQLGYEWVRTTGTSFHWNALGNALGNAPGNSLGKETEQAHQVLKAPLETYLKGPLKTEAEFYQKFGLPWIPPETRETGEEVDLARAGALEQLLPWDGIRGIFHNHTTRSDGACSLEQMAQEALRQGYEYIGVSDHSQSAFYAQGLKQGDLLEQEREIRRVQDRYPQIRIFWGIESDILADGSLDYDSQILSRFDFVIASVHSRFGMDRLAMTERVLKAIRNPYTRFLGHPTGRLLLDRAPFELDMEKVIREAGENSVAIELNANPARLDLDWRWGGEMRKAKTLTSINPDAHHTSGIEDVRFGVTMARKALFPTWQVVNSRSVKEVEKWLKRL